MTEYATDPEVIQEFLTARERTANWVNVHGPGLSFASPSSPPSILSDEDAPSYGPSESDASSSHSVPPRMMLRYDDGRPDVPISQDRYPTHASRSAHPRSSSRHTRSRSGSLTPAHADSSSPRHAQSLSYASTSRFSPGGQPLVTPPRSPENIRVLPSRQAEDSQRLQASSSRVSAAQAIFPQQPSIRDRVPPLADPHHSPNRGMYPSTHRHPPSATQPIPVAASPPTIFNGQSTTGPHNGGSRFYEQPGMASSRVQSALPYQYSPPAIVYAPSGRHGRSNYQPPAIIYSPSSHGHRRAPAPGIAYSRSDPLPHPTQYSPQTNAGSTPFPSVHGSTSHRTRQRSHSTVERDAGRGRSRATSSARDRVRTRSPTPSLSQSDTSSDTSGSTYYVLPSPGQKVQIIVPNSASVYKTTPTSSSRSPRTPLSPSSPSSAAGSPKKPFFARFFSRGSASASGSVDSRGSSGQARGEARGRIPFQWR